MKKKLIFVLVCMLVFSTVAGAISSSKTSNESPEEMTIGRAHTVLAELGTATTCPYCPSHEQYLKQVVGDWELVSLTCSHYNPANGHTPATVARLIELGMGGYPNSFWDGGYRSVLGGQSSVTNLQNAYDACAARSVADVDLDLVVTWLGSAQIKIDVDVTNNEGSTYNGHIHAYILEITSRWLNNAGHPFPNALLDLVFNQDINVVSSGTWSDTITWDGASHGFGDIEEDNILVVASVFTQSNDYADETTSFRVGNNRPPYTPTIRFPPDGATNINVGTDIGWYGGDPDWFDSVTYDVYFEADDSTPDVLVSDDQTGTSYDPGTLEYSTTYYWQIISEDNHAASTPGPIWHFTTREPEPNLDCDGTLGWIDVPPGGVVTGSFTVENIGDPPTFLDWEIQSYPDWGTWTFTPESGDDLTPDYGPFTVEVEVIAPNEGEQTFTGKVKIINSEDPTDSCTIDVSLATPRNKLFNINLLFLRFLENHPHMFPILRHILGV
jgi:hypothetical protein